MRDLRTHRSNKPMHRLSLLLLIALAILAGCATEEQQLVGKWRGKVEMNSAMKNSPYGNMASQYVNMIQPQLDLRPDKTFLLSISMAPIEGTWFLKDGDIVLTPKTFMGMPAGQARKKADDALDKADNGGDHPLGFQMPSAASLIPDTKEIRVKVVDKGESLSLDPAAGTMLGGMGEMTFTKV